MSPEQRQRLLDDEKRDAEERLRRLDARAGQQVVVDLQGLGGALTPSQTSAAINQLKALYSAVSVSRCPAALTLAGLTVRASKTKPELDPEPEPEPEPEAAACGSARPSSSADGSLQAGLTAMGAESWRGVLLELNAVPTDLHSPTDLIYIDALAPTKLENLPRWSQPGAVLVLRPDIADTSVSPPPAGALTARLPLEVLLPSTGTIKRTRAHNTAMQMQVVVTQNTDSTVSH